MSRSLQIMLVAVVLAGVVITSPVAAAADDVPVAKRPNIIFFLSDDHRSDMLGCAGHAILKTPVLDALAADGVRFENAFVTTSICAASRATLLTGLYERGHKYTFGTPPIAEPLAADSYPAVLKRAGYRTGFVGKFGVSVAGEWRTAMFDYFKPLGGRYFKRQPDGSLRHLSEIAGDRAIDFLQEQNPQTPFCLSVSFNAPHAVDGDKENHYPWQKAMDGLYDDVVVPAARLSDPAVFESQPDFLKQSFNRVRWFWRWDTPEKYQKNIRAYYRMISGVDHVIGRVLAELEKLGVADNTVVIFAGDNGYYAASRGFAGKWSHYEESLRVPLIVFDPRRPESQRGKVDSHVVLNVDIAATIVAYAGLEVPQGYQGHALVSLVEGEQPANWRTDFFCEHLMDNRSIPKWEGVRGSRWVYARYFQQEPVFEFLHDLVNDPDQLKNLATDSSYRETLQQMRQRCDELRDSYGGEYSLEKFPLRRR